jgi:hypothetical protein
VEALPHCKVGLDVSLSARGLPFQGAREAVSSSHRQQAASLNPSPIELTSDLLFPNPWQGLLDCLPHQSSFAPLAFRQENLEVFLFDELFEIHLFLLHFRFTLIIHKLVIVQPHFPISHKYLFIQ